MGAFGENPGQFGINELGFLAGPLELDSLALAREAAQVAVRDVQESGSPFLNQVQRSFGATLFPTPGAFLSFRSKKVNSRTAELPERCRVVG